MVHLSTKVFNGYSTCFRQWRASSIDNCLCHYIHGYSLEFKVIFSCQNLDDKNWVQDFGSFKRNNIKEYLNWMFDHTTLIAEDDPHLQTFYDLEANGLIQLRVIKDVGCERFAEFVFNYINDIVSKESNNRVSVESVECFENKTNSAIFKRK